MSRRAHGAMLLGGTLAQQGGRQQSPTRVRRPLGLSPYSTVSSAQSRQLVEEYKGARHAHGGRKIDDYISMGQAYLTSGYAEPAIRCFTSAMLETGPRVDALYGRANAYELMEAHEAAIADYTAAIVLEPLTPQLYKSRASALLALDRYEEALLAYQQVQSVCSIDDDADAKEAYGRCLLEATEHEACEDVLSQVLAKDTGRAVSLMLRACARMELRGPEDPGSVADFEAAHALDPTLPTQLRQRAQNELRAGNAEAAAQTLSRCACLDKNNPLVLFERARCWIRCMPPDVPRALADMNECARRLRAAQSGFGDTEALIGCVRGKADLLLERGRPREAVLAFDELVAMYAVDELPRGVVVGRLRATLEMHARRVAADELPPTDWTAEERARATVDSDILTDVHTAQKGDPAVVDFLLRELEGAKGAHYLRANLLARGTWAKPVGSRRDDATRAALLEFAAAHRCGFDVRACGPGRPGLLVTAAWSHGAAEPAAPPPSEPELPSLAKLALVALAAAGPARSGVSYDAPGFAHAALASLLARETLPTSASAPRPSAAVADTMLVHVLALRRAERTAFERARWAGTVLSANALICATQNGGLLPAVGAPLAKGAPRPEPRSLAMLCLAALGELVPKDRALAHFELPVGRNKVVREHDEAMASFRALWDALRPGADEPVKKGGAKKK